MIQARWLGLYVLLYMLFLYAPALLLPLFAFNDATIIAFPLSGFTTKWFEDLLETEALHSATLNSVYVAVISAVFATTLGVCAARASTRFNFAGKKGIIGFIMLPLVLPEIIVAVSMLVILLQLGEMLGGMRILGYTLDFGLSLNTVIIGHVLICTPFSIAVLTSTFHSFDKSLEEASLDLGESRLSTFFRVTLPLAAPGIISSLLICFTISLDEFIIAFFLTGTDTTLPVYIWGQLRFPQRTPGVMALGTLLLVFSLVILFTAEYFRRRATRRMGRTGSTEGLA